jgi:FtsP/CotA-like multicopper oxidase with cupredoxin domain
MRANVVSVAGLLLVAACGSHGSTTPAPAAPDPWSLAPVVDENADPNVIEFHLEAAETTKQFPGAAAPTPVWDYNGTIPGPLVDAKVGDTIIVHFKNSLPETTTIHWHGVRVPAPMDGTQATQSEIPPGGTFEYMFTLRDAGLFWFHPHVRTDVQVHKGLYGVIRVRGPAEPQVDHEGFLVLDDLALAADGTIPDYLDDMSKMMGREGNMLLVNGNPTPTLPMHAGGVERLRILNVANGRFFNLAIEGYQWHVIGTDGGLVPQPWDTPTLLVAPGERYDVLLIPNGAPAQDLALMNLPYDRGHDSGSQPAMQVATLHMTSDAPLSGRTLPATSADVARLPAGAIDHAITLDEALQNGNQVFTINGATYPNVPMFDVSLGAVTHFRVENKSEMDHPFHVHGVFFQLLSTNGVAIDPARLADKDTIIVPKKSTIDLAAPFEIPGTWMYHCHILEHAENGMMGMLEAK